MQTSTLTGEDMDLKKILIFLILILAIPAVSAAEIRDLSGTWQIIDPDGQYSGSAAIVGGDGIAIINTNIWVIPVRLQERFTIAQVCQGTKPFTCFDTFQIKSQYGVHYISYDAANNELFYDNGEPYAVRIQK